MTTLAEAVLPLIRTPADLQRWSAPNEHGSQMHEGIDMLESALPTVDPADVYAVSYKALASAISVIVRADDNRGQVCAVVAVGPPCRALRGSTKPSNPRQAVH